MQYLPDEINHGAKHWRINLFESRTLHTWIPHKLKFQFFISIGKRQLHTNETYIEVRRRKNP
jgi:hypothetical protein